MEYMFDITADTNEEAMRRVMVLLDLVSFGETAINPNIYIEQLEAGHYAVYDKRRDPNDD